MVHQANQLTKISLPSQINHAFKFRVMMSMGPHLHELHLAPQSVNTS